MRDAERTKLEMAIRGQLDVEKLRELALGLLRALSAATTSDGGYTVVDLDGKELAVGTREYCMGYAEAVVGIVMCGGFEIWPDWGRLTQ